MTRALTRRTSAVALVAALTLAGVVGCSQGTDEGALKVGTTDKVTGLDPAGSYDNGSFTVMNQVYPFLMNTPYGSPDPEPDIAESARFTSPTEFTVRLKPDLTFANGNALTASDVKFSFDRQLAIKDPNGPSALLSNLEKTETVDDTTVVFHLKTPDDQTFAQVLASPAGPVVDEEVFSANEVTPDSAIVSGQPFAGPYTITGYSLNEQIAYRANPDYRGLLGAPRTEKIAVTYYARSSSLKRDVQQGTVDVAYRSLSPTDVADLRKDDKVKVVEGPGGEIRYIVLNIDTQPYGATTDEADPAKALAVRQAVAHLLDRETLSDYVYRGTFVPLYSAVPAGLTGATAPMRDLYGDGTGGPSVDHATQVLAEAEVTTPVALSLQYTDHYGPSSSEEYALIKNQLEVGGLFRVKLADTEWAHYSEDRIMDAYPAYQLGWFPDCSDADSYLTPFFLADSFLASHFQDPTIDDAIVAQRSTTDPAERTALLEQVQADIAAQLPTVPYLQSVQVAVTGTNVTGAERTLDASYRFRYGALALVTE
ncbi:MAG: ABC transporter substrate-binding protein [Micrococcales bacterium]|nr:ABC transporter substrate-binding protein [Micrococcales bacterium]